jgi:small-conductance mechanosensitive channel
MKHVAAASLLAQGDDGESGSGGTLLSDLGDEIKVTLDRWSVGQLGLADLVVAAAVLVTGALLAWLASRVIKRVARRNEGAARAAIATVGLLVGSAIVLLASALALEVLGFSLGPILVIILITIVALLLLRPLVTNLSSGLLLQLRGALVAGDLICTNDVLGTVHEINARSVVLDTPDGRRVHVPNSDVLNGTIENYTSLGRRRSSLDVMIDGQADVDDAITVIAAAVREAEMILDDPPAEVELAGMRGQFADIRIHVWHGPTVAEQRAAVHSATRALVRVCAAEHIELGGPAVVTYPARLPDDDTLHRAVSLS